MGKDWPVKRGYRTSGLQARRAAALSRKHFLARGRGVPKHYAVREDLTPGSPVNFRMRRHPGAIRFPPAKVG